MDTNVSNNGKKSPTGNDWILPCGLTKANNNIVGLVIGKMPPYLPFKFTEIFKNISQEEFRMADESMMSWAVEPFENAVTGLELCFQFFKDNEFIEELASNKHRLTDKGRQLKDKGDYQNYVYFVISEKGKADALQKQVTQMAHKQLITNRLIAGGTSVAAMYYLLETIKHHISNFDLNVLTSFFVFCAGSCVGVITILIIWELATRNNKQDSN